MTKLLPRIEAFCMCGLLAEYQWPTGAWTHVPVRGSIREHYPVTVGWFPRWRVQRALRHRRKLIKAWCR